MAARTLLHLPFAPLGVALALTGAPARAGVPAGEPLGPTAGTAFSISASGVWLTARHVVDGCARAVVMTRPESGAVAQVRVDARSDVAVLVTDGGAPALPLALDAPLRVGERGFHPGFPQGEPGGAASRLLDRRPWDLGAPDGLSTPVLAWKVGREGRSAVAVDGLSGAPVLDRRGRVVGLTLAQSPRGSRLYGVAPVALANALARLKVRPEAAFGVARPLTPAAFGDVSDTLRRELSVVQVRCLER